MIVSESKNRLSINALFMATMSILRRVEKTNKDPSKDSSIGSILAWYRGGPRFKSRQGRKFFSENKQLDCSNLNTNI